MYPTNSSLIYSLPGMWANKLPSYEVCSSVTRYFCAVCVEYVHLCIRVNGVLTAVIDHSGSSSNSNGDQVGRDLGSFLLPRWAKQLPRVPPARNILLIQHQKPDGDRSVQADLTLLLASYFVTNTIKIWKLITRILCVEMSPSNL